jgi:hypothetical protein
MKAESTSIAGVVADIVEGLRFDAEWAYKEIIVDCVGDMMAIGDYKVLYGPMHRIVADAVKCAPERSAVRIAVWMDHAHRMIQITVSDECRGTSPVALEDTDGLKALGGTIAHCAQQGKSVVHISVPMSEEQ